MVASRPDRVSNQVLGDSQTYGVRTGSNALPAPLALIGWEDLRRSPLGAIGRTENSKRKKRERISAWERILRSRLLFNAQKVLGDAQWKEAAVRRRKICH